MGAGRGELEPCRCQLLHDLRLVDEEPDRTAVFVSQLPGQPPHHAGIAKVVDHLTEQVPAAGGGGRMRSFRCQHLLHRTDVQVKALQCKLAGCQQGVVLRQQPVHPVRHRQIEELAVIRVAAAQVAGWGHIHLLRQRLPLLQGRLLLNVAQSELRPCQHHRQLAAHGMRTDGPVVPAFQPVAQRLHTRVSKNHEVQPDVGVDDEAGHGRWGRQERKTERIVPYSARPQAVWSE